MSGRAIALLHRGLSNRPHAAAMKVVQRLAKTHGLELIETVEIDEHTYLPIAFILNEADRARAGVIIAPSLEHLGAGREVVPRSKPVLVPTGYADRQPA